MFLVNTFYKEKQIADTLFIYSTSFYFYLTNSGV